VSRVLFVSNGHGEIAIADRIAAALAALDPRIECDHLALVGDVRTRSLRDVGPRKPMPSGGLIAMGNLPNIARDLGAGLAGLTLAQARFLRGSHGRYDAAIAVGDVFALMMALLARVPAIFVVTAKSVRVAPYGPFEERVLRAARVRFVRDVDTAARLREHGVQAQAANVIVDLYADADPALAARALAGFAPAIALLPGSRASAYDDARFLAGVVSRLATGDAHLGAALSIAPGLDVDAFAGALRAGGFDVEATDDPLVPFSVRVGGRTIVRAWRGAVGALFPQVVVALGQAGTANEAAAASGVPVVAFERGRDRKTAWYRKRQSGLLGEALAIAPEEPGAAAAAVRGLLDDPARRATMAAAGRANMGPPGGAARIAAQIVALAGDA
jgi:uncharacterized protein (TIGR03492 family)